MSSLQALRGEGLINQTACITRRDDILNEL